MSVNFAYVPTNFQDEETFPILIPNSSEVDIELDLYFPNGYVELTQENGNPITVHRDMIPGPAVDYQDFYIARNARIQDVLKVIYPSIYSNAIETAAQKHFDQSKKKNFLRRILFLRD